MELFLNLIETFAYLFMIVLAGVIVGKYIDIDLHKVSKFNEIIMAPAFIFGSLLLVDMNINLLWITLLALLVMCLVSLIGWKGAERFGHDHTGNLIGLCGAMGNSGNFGIPVVTVLFGAAIVPLYSVFIVANILYAASVGYYIAGRGRLPVLKSLFFVLKLPMIHAAIIALFIQFFTPDLRFDMTQMIEPYWDIFVKIVVAYGLFVIGIAFGEMTFDDFHWHFQLPVFITRFGLAPLLTFLALYIESRYFNVFTPIIRELFIVFSVMPCARKVIMMAAMTDIEPGKAAAAVLTTTIFATCLIPPLALLFF